MIFLDKWQEHPDVPRCCLSLCVRAILSSYFVTVSVRETSRVAALDMEASVQGEVISRTHVAQARAREQSLSAICHCKEIGIKHEW